MKAVQRAFLCEDLDTFFAGFTVLRRIRVSVDPDPANDLSRQARSAGLSAVDDYRNSSLALGRWGKETGDDR